MELKINRQSEVITPRPVSKSLSHCLDDFYRDIERTCSPTQEKGADIYLKEPIETLQRRNRILPKNTRLCRSPAFFDSHEPCGFIYHKQLLKWCLIIITTADSPLCLLQKSEQGFWLLPV